MAKTIPLASQEVRWFFDGTATQHESLKRWFETIVPIPQRPGVGPLVWQGRLDDQPDVYLLVPGSDDMGIKWREGKLQMKGRASVPRDAGVLRAASGNRRTLDQVVVHAHAGCVSPAVYGGAGVGAGDCCCAEDAGIAQGAIGHVDRPDARS